MAHEAGYDAYMTGFVFLKLTSYLDKTRNPKKYELIEAQRKAEEEAKEREKEEKSQPRVDADGWEISDDEQGGGEWDTNEDEEEVFHYGSIQVDLANKLGKMDNVLTSIKNKTALVRTAYTCFDFVEPQQISKFADGVHITYPAGTTKEEVHLLFSPFGKHIVETIDDQSSFVVFEDFTGNLDQVVQQATKEGWKVTKLSEK